MIFHINGNQQCRMAIIISDKIDLELKTNAKTKNVNYIRKTSTDKKVISILSIYASNFRVPRNMK